MKNTIKRLYSLVDKLNKVATVTSEKIISASLENRMDRLADDLYDIAEKLENELKISAKRTKTQ